jgi:hypothetical protein
MMQTVRTRSSEIATIAIAALMVLPATATAQPPRHPAQNMKKATSSKEASAGKSSGGIAGTNNRFALLLLQSGTIGPITSSVIAGGGGTSAAGSFSVSGTIGQAAAGPALTGSNYSVTSGFWAADYSNTPVAKKRRGQITSQD